MSERGPGLGDEAPPRGPDASEAPRFAAIDIGTNSVLLLVAARTGGGFEAVEERMEITRLGAGVDQTGVLTAEAMGATLAAARSFAERARALGAEGLAITATSAARDAANGPDFLDRLREETGVSAQILSGEEEAALTFASAAHEPGPVVVVDIGGGSTEFIYGVDGAVDFRASFDVGCVRLTERWLRSDPPAADELARLREDLEAAWADLPRPAPGTTLVGVAGTVTTLCALHLGLSAYDGALVHGQRLSLDDARALAQRLAAASLEERLALPGLPPKRADVIVAGAEILVAAMERLGADEVEVSDRGVRWGLLNAQFGRP